MLCCAVVSLLQEMRELEARLEQQHNLTPQDQDALTQNVQDTTDRLRSLLYLARGTIETLAVTTSEVGTHSAHALQSNHPESGFLVC